MTGLASVRNLGRHQDGYWIAEASLDGPYVPVQRKYGSWMQGYHPTMKDVPAAVAAECQRLVIKAERKERR